MILCRFSTRLRCELRKLLTVSELWNSCSIGEEREREIEFLLNQLYVSLGLAE